MKMSCGEDDFSRMIATLLLRLLSFSSCCAKKQFFFVVLLLHRSMKAFSLLLDEHNPRAA